MLRATLTPEEIKGALKISLASVYAAIRENALLTSVKAEGTTTDEAASQVNEKHTSATPCANGKKEKENGD